MRWPLFKLRGIPSEEICGKWALKRLARCQMKCFATSTAIPERAEVVIAGGGLAGLCVMYHLLKANIKNVVLFERQRIGSGISWLNGGLISSHLLWQHPQTQALADYSTAFYTDLEASYDHIGYRKCGRVLLTADPYDSLTRLKRIEAYGRARSFDVRMMGAKELTDFLGPASGIVNERTNGLWIGEDANLNGQYLLEALKIECERLGGQLIENSPVEAITLSSFDDARVKSVKVGQTDVECQVFVNTSGVWASNVFVDGVERNKMQLPLCPLQHSSMIVQKSEVFTASCALHNMDANVILAPDAVNPDQLHCSGFSDSGSTPLKVLPDFFAAEQSNENWDEFYPILESLVAKFPIIEKAKVELLVSGAEGVTPDGYPLIGELPWVRNCFILNGWNNLALSMIPGAANLLATWILNQEPGQDVSHIDVARFLPLHYNNKYLRDRAPEVIGQSHKLVHPKYDQCKSARFLRTSPVFQGNERAVVNYLQKLCSAEIDRPIGTTIYTGMQNEYGGYVTDCTISRLAPNRFFMIAPTNQQIRLMLWLQRHLPENNQHVSIHDVTSMYTAMNVLGPASRQLMNDLTEAPMRTADFPHFHCRELSVGYASGIRAISVSHTGELGWVLYIPDDFSRHVYHQIIEAGKPYGLRHAGYYAMRNLRIEKFYVYWGQDIDYTTTPMECGREFRVNFEKPDFIGKEALLKQRREGVKRRYVQLLVQNHDPSKDVWPQGGEPIYRDGKFCGLTTSAGYGFTFGCQVCLGYIKNMSESNEPQVVTSSWLTGKDIAWEVDIAGKRFPVHINLHSPKLPMISSEHPQHYRPTQE